MEYWIDIRDTLTTWAQETLLSLDTYIQLGILSAAFLIAFMAFRFVKPKVRTLINTINVHHRIRKILHNLTLLIFPAMTLALLFPVKVLAETNVFPIEFGFGNAVMGLLSAWIFIRLIVQFIDNNIVRNAIALLIWSIAALNILGILDETTTVRRQSILDTALKNIRCASGSLV